MSRVGRKPVKILDKVTVTVAGRVLKVKGPLGELTALMPVGVDVEVDGDVATVKAPAPARGNGGFQGLTRALLANMVYGVVHGYEKSLEEC